MADGISKHLKPIDAPAEGGFDIDAAKSNTVNLPSVTRGIYIGSTGNMKIMLYNGDIVTMKNIQDGSFFPLRALRVYTTGTTATSIIGFN